MYGGVALDIVSSAPAEGLSAFVMEVLLMAPAVRMDWLAEVEVGDLEYLPVFGSSLVQNHSVSDHCREALNLALRARCPIEDLEELQHLRPGIAGDARLAEPGHSAGWACPWIDHYCEVIAVAL